MDLTCLKRKGIQVATGCPFEVMMSLKQWESKTQHLHALPLLPRQHEGLVVEHTGSGYCADSY